MLAFSVCLLSLTLSSLVLSGPTLLGTYSLGQLSLTLSSLVLNGTTLLGAFSGGLLSLTFSCVVCFITALSLFFCFFTSNLNC
jgi:hypothetical protein